MSSNSTQFDPLYPEELEVVAGGGGSSGGGGSGGGGSDAGGINVGSLGLPAPAAYHDWGGITSGFPSPGGIMGALDPYVPSGIGGPVGWQPPSAIVNSLPPTFGSFTLPSAAPMVGDQDHSLRLAALFVNRPIIAPK